MRFPKILAFAATAIALALAAGCNNDDPDKAPEPQTFVGTITSAIPQFSDFQPSVSNDECTVTWADAEQSSASFALGGFKVTIAQMGREIEIGDMAISNIPCAKVGNKIMIKKTEFTTQAGAYEVKGTIEGEITPSEMVFELIYKPGSMPFDVQSVFAGE